MTTLDDRLLPVFAAQHWLVGVDDVRRGGRDGEHGRGSASNPDDGRKPTSTCTDSSGVPSSWHSRLLAPILAIGGGAVASHFAAAALHGIEGFGRGAPEISIPRGREHRRTAITVHTSTDLDRCRDRGR